jgi:CBS-domain-containing membrane protein
MSEQPKCPKPRKEDYERALQSMDTFIDIGVTDLMDLTERAQHFANQRTAESLLVSRIMSQPCA